MISIVIPIYNVASFLDQCIQSIAFQSYPNFECILVDDGSTDGSELICDKWAVKDTRIKVLHQNNQGVSVARNRGIEKAKGEYITFVDSDDWIESTYLEDMITPMLSHDVDLVISGLIQRFKDGTSKSFCGHTEWIELNDNFVKEFVDLNKKYLLFGPFVKLYKSSIIKEHSIQFPLEYSYGEDLIFNYHYLSYIRSLYVIDRINYNYRILGTGTLSSKKRSDQFQIDYEQWKILKAFYLSHNMLTEYSSAYLYDRLWWCMYDAILATPVLLFGKSVGTKVQHIRRIFCIDEWNELMAFVKTLHLPFWLKFCVMYKMSVVLVGILEIKNKKK